jgi:hypothetical protein
MLFKQTSAIVMKALLLSLLMVKSALADDVSIVGSIKHHFKKNNISSHTGSEHSIQLLQVELSDEEKNYLARQANDALSHKGQFSQESLNSQNYLAIPEKVQNGMNKVPVLDQGIHGTCVTFAVTGAIDALIGKGDYVSQLCNLQLGKYLANHGGSPSGWDGSYPRDVINQITQYGVVNKAKQKSIGCGGLTEYPAKFLLTGDSIDPEKFHSMSELVFGKVANWSSVFVKHQPAQTLTEVKQALQSGDRVIFAVLLPRPELGTVGAVGKHKTWIAKDSWVLTPTIINSAKNAKTAHELIITGYDDNATAVDARGIYHKGLLTLRNSWGSSRGNYGEFYMAYDYFKYLAFDAERFSSNSN